MNLGILGAGKIASVLSETAMQMEDICLYAIASRDLDKAQRFAEKYNFQTAYGSYEELVNDSNVDLVYVATPHSHHFEHMKLCIEHGKPVLCEKAFTVNASQAKEIIALAQEKKVFLAEAIWTRYMPSRKIIDELIASGIIGKISMVMSNLSYIISDKPRLIQPELAGGALLDIGIYGLNFMLMHMGKNIDHIESSVMMTNTGVDGNETISIFYSDGSMGVTAHSIYARSDRKGMFHGDKGYIVIDNINNPLNIDVFDTSDNLIKHIDVPQQISGYEYELLECMDCIRNGKLEPDSMPLSETIYVMELMDSIRKQWGMVYPME